MILFYRNLLTAPTQFLGGRRFWVFLLIPASRGDNAVACFGSDFGGRWLGRPVAS